MWLPVSIRGDSKWVTSSGAQEMVFSHGPPIDDSDAAVQGPHFEKCGFRGCKWWAPFGLLTLSPWF